MKAAVKLALHLAATVLVSPVLLAYFLGSLALGKDRAIEGATQALAPLPGITGIYLRRAFLCLALKGCHRSCEVGFGTLDCFRTIGLVQLVPLASIQLNVKFSECTS